MNAPDPLEYSSAATYEKALERSGWTRIGGGAGGGVYHREGDSEVIKVSDGDDCYLAFASFAAQNPQPCLPRLRIVFRGDDWAVTHSEFLEAITVENAFEVGKWWGGYIISQKAKAVAPQPPVFSIHAPTWTALMLTLAPVASSTSCGFDVKMENIMKRPSTGEVVFIDFLFHAGRKQTRG